MKPKAVYSIVNEKRELLKADVIQTHKELFCIGEIIDNNRAANIHCFPMSLDLIDAVLKQNKLKRCKLVK